MHPSNTIRHALEDVCKALFPKAERARLAQLEASHYEAVTGLGNNSERALLQAVADAESADIPIDEKEARVTAANHNIILGVSRRAHFQTVEREMLRQFDDSAKRVLEELLVRIGAGVQAAEAVKDDPVLEYWGQTSDAKERLLSALATAKYHVEYSLGDLGAGSPSLGRVLLVEGGVFEPLSRAERAD